MLALDTVNVEQYIEANVVGPLGNVISCFLFDQYFDLDYLFTELTLVSTTASVLRGRVLDDVLFAEDGDATDLAVVLPDRQREGRVVEHGAMCSVVQWMSELEIASATI